MPMLVPPVCMDEFDAGTLFYADQVEISAVTTRLRRRRRPPPDFFVTSDWATTPISVEASWVQNLVLGGPVTRR